MKQQRSHSITLQQTKYVIIIALTLGLSFSFIQIFIDYLGIEASLQRQANQISNSTADAAAKAAFTYDEDLAQQIVNGLLQFEPVISATISDEHDQPLYHLERPINTHWSNRFYQPSPIKKMIDLTSGDYAHHARVGALEITLSPSSSLRQFEQRALSNLVGGLLRAGLLAIALMYLFHRMLTRPLMQLSQDFSEVNTSQPSMGMLPDSARYPNNEFRKVVDVGNQLLQTISQNLESLQASRESLEHQVSERTHDLLKSKQRLQDAQRIARLGNWEWNMRTNTLWWSPETYRLFGVDQHSFKPSSENFFQFLSRQDQSRVRTAIRNTIITGEPYSLEFTILRHDGTRIECASHAEARPDGSGEINIVAGTYLDISERKRSERLITQQNRLIELLHSVTSIANEATDPKQALHLSLNEMCRFFEWPIGHYFIRDENNPGKLQSSGIWHLQGDGDYQAFIALTESMTPEPNVDLPGKIMAHAEPIWINDISQHEECLRAHAAAEAGLHGHMGFPVLMQGEVMAVMEFFSQQPASPSSDDLNAALRHIGIQLGRVMERAASEETLREAKREAEYANRAKSDFLSKMSHELRTPMNAILGFAQLIEYSTDQTSEEQEYAREILQAGDHLLKLINEVLDLAKIETGRLAIAPKNTPLSDLLAECLKLTDSLAQRKQVKVDIQLYQKPCNIRTLADEQIQLYVDPVRAKQALLNLLSNAIKYNHPNGNVWINCEAIDDRMFSISVQDNGPGLTAEKQLEVFTPFNRLGAENSDTEGTGIGLVITKQITELMNGSIDFTSQPGEGSTFVLQFPLAHADQTADPEQLEKPETTIATVVDAETDNTLYSLLYIEDNPANVRLVKRLLERRPDIRLFTAEKPLPGIELAKQQQPDLILLDINLPEIDGYEVLNRLRQDEQTRSIEVIAISANAMPADIQRGKEAGFTEYLTKPIDVPQFLDLVDQSLPLRPTSTNCGK